MYHDNKYETMSKTAKNIYARSFMIEISEIHRTIEHRVIQSFLLGVCVKQKHYSNNCQSRNKFFLFS
jgi:hypothetical protein